MITFSEELRQDYGEQGGHCCVHSLASGFASVMARFFVLFAMTA